MEKMVQTLDRRRLHLIAALSRQCHELKLISEVDGDRPPSSITFTIDIFSFDQYFRSYRERVSSKNIKTGFF